MADIIYLFEGTPYFNLTNKCPCNCTFCIRDRLKTMGEAESMWHRTQPTFCDVKAAIDSFDFSRFETAVFCGYGEPTNELELLLKTAEYLKKTNPKLKLRLNTNGLSDLINKSSTAKDICKNIDAVSISLNATDSEKYDEITRNIFKGKAFDAMLKFTSDCVNYCDNVTMSVVDVISKEEIEKARQICEKTGAKFRVREFTDSE